MFRNHKFIIKILTTFQHHLKEQKEKVFSLYPAIAFQSIEILANSLQAVLTCEQPLLSEDVLNLLEMQAFWTLKNYSEQQFT